MKDKFIKNGVFSLEYDKETLRDMVLELQEENQELKAELQLYQGALKREHEAIHRVNDLEEVIDKAKTLNHEISHTIYEEFLEENIIGSKFLYERIKKQLSILEDKEVSE